MIVDISKVKYNPKNPRIIKDYKFKKLVKSLKDFPEMLEKRPIVVDEDMIVLGGNMRLKACHAAGFSTVHILVAEGWTDEQKDEFIIKDNGSFGEWDWDILANEWNPSQINDWGLDLPKVYFEDEEEPQLDKDIFDQELDTYINAKIKQITLYFNSDEYEKAIEDLEKIRDKENLTDNTQVFKFLIKKYGL